MRSALGKPIRTRFARRMAEALPEFVELPASANKGLGVRVHAWRASERLKCFVWLQTSHNQDELTINLAWGPGPGLPASMHGPRDAATMPPAEGRMRIGLLMPAKNDLWWSFYERPSMLDGAWAEKFANPPSVESLAPLVEPLVESMVAAIVGYALPYFARVAEAANVKAPERWTALAASIASPPMKQARNQLVVAGADAPPLADAPLELSALPRLDATTAATAVGETTDPQLARALAYFEGVHARVAETKLREALDQLVPRYQSLARAASAIVVPFQEALEAKLTPAQRRTLDELAPASLGPTPDEHLVRLLDDAARWAQVVFWAQAFASRLRTYRQLGSDEVKRALVPLVAMAEAYQKAAEQLA